ncbi:MAG: lamin tail domain-containing protein [Pirellulales bacterium]|nr:lamin tail domain-containing protein [Pirellulales bacterium]
MAGPRGLDRKLLMEPLEPRLVLDGSSLVISEFMADNETVLADWEGDYEDWLEIYNPTADPVDLTGWYLTDDQTDPKQWPLPEMTIAAGEYRVIFASGKDLTDPAGELHTDFSLSRAGEYLALVQGKGAEATIVSAYAPEYPQQYEDVSYGLHSDLVTEGYFLQPTPGDPNDAFPVDDPTNVVLISEIMYHPVVETYNADAQVFEEEYIELVNRGPGAIDLGGWQLTEGVAFTFPDVTLEPGAFLVVAADPAAFQTTYQPSPEVTVVGGWTGRLSNSGEEIELVDAAGRVMDRVTYADEGDWAEREARPPDQWGHAGWVWSDAHDGLGKSLELVTTALSNENGKSWTASMPDGGTPGQPNSAAAADVAPLILNTSHWPAIPRSTDAVAVTAQLKDELDTGVTATVYYRSDGAATFNTAAMRDDGQSGDGDAGDGVYGAMLPARPNGTIVELYVEASDGTGHARTWPAPTQPSGQQLTNLLYQVNDTFDPIAAWVPGDPPVYYLIMTEVERAELADIGDGGDVFCDEPRSDAQMNGTFISIDGGSTQVHYNVGIRNRGNQTRAQQPNNYRVNFPQDKAWKGVTAININSNHSFSQVIGSAMFRMAGIAAPDATAVRVRVNGQDLALAGSHMYGVYSAVEVYDSDYADHHYPDDSTGNVYRASYNQPCGGTRTYADFCYKGVYPYHNPDDYRLNYPKRTNESEDDWSDLFDLLDALNNPTGSDAEFLAELNQIVDVRQWMRFLAADFLLGNGEGGLVTGSGDDFAMYCGRENRQFQLLPHDLDTLFSTRATTIWTYDRTGICGLNRMFDHPEIVRIYFQEHLDLISTVFAPENFNPIVEELLGNAAPQSTIDSIKSFVAQRVAGVLGEIPQEFRINNPSLPTSGGFPITDQPTVALSGTAHASETASVLVDGRPAVFLPRTGQWTASETTGGYVADTLVASDTLVAYHVPTAGEDPLGWTATEYNDSHWIRATEVEPAGLVITEISTGQPRFVEIENVSREAIDTTGWSVLVNSASAGNVNDVLGTAWSLPDSIGAGDVLYRTDDAAAGDAYWGSQIAWNAEGPGWTMIIDDSGNVMDFVAWGYGATEIASLEVSFGPWTGIRGDDQWSGPGAAVGTAGQGGQPVSRFVAYNDHFAGAGTHADTTTYAANGTATGLLKDIATGSAPGVTLTTSQNAVEFDNSSNWPAAGTDAYSVFNGYVDFSAGTGCSLELDADLGASYTHTFSGLDTGDEVTYDFAGTSVRGNSSYINRWIQVTLVGAEGIAAHSSGWGVIVLDAKNVALMVGDNAQADQGFIVGWTEIDPGTDGEFAIVTTQYVGPTPGIGSGMADGRIGYGLTAIRLEEVGPGQPLSFLRREGDSDSQTADDFARTDAGSQGVENPDLTVPFGSVVANRQGVGFSAGQPQFDAVIRTNVAEVMQGVNASLWTRVEFPVGDTTPYDTLTLRMKYDDGFVAYLNGTEIARRNADSPLAYDTAASAEHPNALAVQFEEIDVTAFLGALRPGTNVLAIHGQNLAAADSDFLIQGELAATGGTPGMAPQLHPGVNRICVQTFDGPNGTGNQLQRDFIDVWYDPPTPPKDSEKQQVLDMTVRDSYLSGVPVLVRVEVHDDQNEVDRELWDAVATLSSDNPNVTISPNQVTLYNGLGSGLITFTGTEPFQLTASIAGLGLDVSSTLTSLDGMSIASVSGALSGNTTFSGVVHVTGNLTVPDGSTLTLDPGTLVLIDGVASGSGGTVITVAGDIQSLGTKTRPVTFTAYTAGENWGEILHDNAEPSLYLYTNINQGGHSTARGHSNTGPTIRNSGGNTIVFDHANLTDEAGKVMHGSSGENLTFRDCIMARAVMGPEIWPSSLLIEDTWITDMHHVDDADGIYIQSVRAPNALMTGGVSAVFDDDAIDTLSAEIRVEDWIVRDANDKGFSIYDDEVWISRCLVVDNAKNPEDGIAASIASKGYSDEYVTVNMDHVTVVATPMPEPDVDVGVYGWDKYGRDNVHTVFNITNSIIVATDPITTDYDPAEIHIDYTALFSEDWPGVGNVNADPLFVDTASHDYHLQAGSPSIDAGDPNDPLDPDGTRADQGYYAGEGGQFAPQIIPGGHITHDTILIASGGPYRVTGDVIVDAGITMTIYAGTTVFFEPGTGLTINGRLVAEGTEYDEIRLTAVPGSGYWDGVQLLDTIEDNRIAYTVLEYGRDGNNGMIGLTNSSLLVDHATFDHTDRRRIRSEDSKLIVRNSTFENIFELGTPPTADNVNEHIWGDGEFIIENNIFGTITGHNDAIDVNGVHRPGPVLQILGNTFLGGGDDALDLEGDAHIEGNTFQHYRKDQWNTGSGNANAISAGAGYDYVMVRNTFYDVDHVAQVKSDSFMTFVHNTVVDVEYSALYFLRPTSQTDYGRGAYVDGNVFFDTPRVFDEIGPDVQVTAHRSILPAAEHGYGVGNLDENPRLADSAGGDFSLLPGSPALGTGPAGLDMGAMVPGGVPISGEPSAVTPQTSAALTVGIAGVPPSVYAPYTHYKYRLNNGPFSAEIPVETPIELTGLADGTYTLYAIGRNSAGVWQDEMEATASGTWTVDTTTPRVRINEVLAGNASVLEVDGTWPDLIELVNCGATAVDLGGMSISDDPGDPEKFVFPDDGSVVLQPGQYLVLYAGEETDESGQYLGFALSSDGDGVYLYDAEDKAGPLIDSVEFGPQIRDLSIGRVGQQRTWALTSPTLGAENVAHRTGNPTTLKINEWLALGEVLFADDFIELYNPDPLPVPLAGLYLTDNPVNQPQKHQVLPLSFAGGNGFAVFVADGDSASGGNHLGFRLSQEQELIGLYDAQLGEIDKILYYPQTTDVSHGRNPDGATTWEFFPLPTPGLTNDVANNELVERGLEILASLRITELMYHPAEDANMEFIELQNVGGTLLDVTGMRLRGGIEFTFPPMLLAPGQYVLVVSDRGEFESRYGSFHNVAGQFSGNLSNSGEEIILQLPDPLDAACLRFTYSDSWYPQTDGPGFALEVSDPAGKPRGWMDAANWRAGAMLGGTPGTADGQPIARSVVINEVLTHTDPPLTDAIELYNATDADIDVGGWYLSDSAVNYCKFRIPDGTTVVAGGYVVFDEDDFNPTPLTPGPNDFALNGAHGDDVFLWAGNAEGLLLRSVDHVAFPAAANGESFGRWPNGSGPLYPMSQTTFEPADGANSGPRVGPVVISEIQYNSGDVVGANELEFIEIYNSGNVMEDLTDWRLLGAIEYDFPAGTALGPGSMLVIVPFDPADLDLLAAFRTRYWIDGSVAVVGGYARQLNDDGGVVRLQRPDEPPLDEPDFIPRLLEDEVRYDDEAPWPVEPDGTGDSLNRLGSDLWGNEGGNWTPLPPTPGYPVSTQPSVVAGRYVFYNNSAFDGNNPAANAQDDTALATDKRALRSGETATFVNYTSYSRGINGIIVDMGRLSDGVTLGAEDFQFRMGNSNAPATWVAAPDPLHITMRAGAGAAGSDRVTIIWEDYVIAGQWLQVTVRATEDTGLRVPDVFYFGNAVGEAGNSTLDAKVNASDMLLARNNPRNFLNPADVDFDYDFNRDARVNATDMLIARNNQTHFLNALKLITVPAGKAAEEGASSPAQSLQQEPVLSLSEDWLYELDRITSRKRSAGQVDSPRQAVDEAVFSNWS